MADPCPTSSGSSFWCQDATRGWMICTCIIPSRRVEFQGSGSRAGARLTSRDIPPAEDSHILPLKGGIMDRDTLRQTFIS